MPRPRSITLTGLLWLFVAGFGAATILAQLGHLSWFFELFCHFPMQYSIALLIVALVAIVLRRWGMTVCAVAILIPNLFALSYYFPTRRDSSERSDLRVISFNVLKTNSSFEEVHDYLATSEADLILVLEIGWTWLDSLAPLKERYPHIVTEPRFDNFGIALFSRHPIKSHQILSLEGSQVPCISAEVDLGNHNLVVIGGHPVPPVGGAHAASRNEYLQAPHDDGDLHRRPHHRHG